MPTPVPVTSPAPEVLPMPSVVPVASPAPSPSPVSERKVAVVIVNGGYNSCAGDVPTTGPNANEIAETNYLTTVGDRAMTSVIEPLKDKGYEVYWTISCFWGNTSSTLQLKSSTNPTRAEIINWSETAPGVGQTLYYNYLTTRVQTYMGGAMSEMRLILIGHSNGGYNVLKLAEGLADSTSFATLNTNTDVTFVKQVHTLDPISVACSPTSIGFSTTLNWGAMPPACLRAPTSTEVNYTKIKDSFDVVDNYYQTDYTTLHSGSYSPASSNTLVSLPGTQSTSNNSHTRITSDNSTWSSIGNQAVP